MRPAMLLSLLLFAVPSVCSQETPAKLAELFVHPDFLWADGVWRPDNLTEKTELAFNTATHLECYKHGGEDIVGKAGYCMQATASVGLGVPDMPDIQVEYFPVITWDREKVIAADSATAAMPICTWTQITVNLKDHSVMATDTKKLGKGHDGFMNLCEKEPLAQTYHLIDTVEERTRRHIRASKLNKEKKCP